MVHIYCDWYIIYYSLKSSHSTHPLTWDALARRHWVDVDTVLLEGELCAIERYNVAWARLDLTFSLVPRPLPGFQCSLHVILLRMWIRLSYFHI